MNSQIKAEWTAALRSGNYCQGHHFMYADGRFCCLGVLCDVVDNTKWKTVNGVNYYDGNPYDLTVDMLKKIGLSDTMMSNLVGLNDDDGWDFDQIANYIEDNA